MMGRTLPKSEWKAYFDHLSKHLIVERAEVEIAGLKSGGHIEARWVPLIGITYEPKGDVLEVALEDLDHLIHQPRNRSPEKNIVVPAQSSWTEAAPRM